MKRTAIEWAEYFCSETGGWYEQTNEQKIADFCDGIRREALTEVVCVIDKYLDKIPGGPVSEAFPGGQVYVLGMLLEEILHMRDGK